jgi:hypothetical protein
VCSCLIGSPRKVRMSLRSGQTALSSRRHFKMEPAEMLGPDATNADYQREFRTILEYVAGFCCQ